MTASAMHGSRRWSRRCLSLCSLAHAARAAKSATSSIPILFVISDSVDEGLVTSGYGGFALSGCSVSVSRSLVGLPRRLMYQTDPLLYWENERAKVQLGISRHLPHEANLLHVHFDKQVRLALWGGTHNGAGMTGAQTSGQGFLYNAFISYRHVDRDRQWAASLINALKGYCAFNAAGAINTSPINAARKTSNRTRRRFRNGCMAMSGYILPADCPLLEAAWPKLTWIKFTQRATPTKFLRGCPYESRKPYENRIRWVPGFAHDRYPAPRSDTVGGKGRACPNLWCQLPTCA
jgi:hypothetical protein